MQKEKESGFIVALFCMIAVFWIDFSRRADYKNGVYFTPRKTLINGVL